MFLTPVESNVIREGLNATEYKWWKRICAKIEAHARAAEEDAEHRTPQVREVRSENPDSGAEPGVNAIYSHAKQIELTREWLDKLAKLSLRPNR